jgi:hypothetical protein
MATNSGLFVSTMRDALDTTGLGVDYLLTTHKLALFNSTAYAAITYNEDPARYGTAPFAANECYGTNWAQGGVLLSAAATGGTSTAPTFVVSSGSLVYDMADVNVASVTVANARGVLLYADALTNKEALLFVDFGATYSAGDGAFNIKWGVGGVFAIDLTA